jgi:hypothetical protein
MKVICVACMCVWASACVLSGPVSLECWVCLSSRVLIVCVSMLSFSVPLSVECSSVEGFSGSESSVNSKGFWRWCMTPRIYGFLDVVHRPLTSSEWALGVSVDPSIRYLLVPACILLVAVLEWWLYVRVQCFCDCIFSVFLSLWVLIVNASVYPRAEWFFVSKCLISVFKSVCLYVFLCLPFWVFMMCLPIYQTVCLSPWVFTSSCLSPYISCL